MGWFVLFFKWQFRGPRKKKKTAFHCCTSTSTRYQGSHFRDRVHKNQESKIRIWKNSIFVISSTSPTALVRFSFGHWEGVDYSAGRFLFLSSTLGPVLLQSSTACDCLGLHMRKGLDPMRTAVPFWGQSTQILSHSSPKRVCGPVRVDYCLPRRTGLPEEHTHTHAYAQPTRPQTP